MNKSKTSNTYSSKWLSSLLCRFAGFFDGKLHRFTIENNKLCLVPVDSEFTPRLLIVSPLFCKEKQLQFPISDKNELSKLLKLSLTEGEIPIIQNQESEQSYVNTWSFNENVPSALVRIPEALLLGENCENSVVLEVSASDDSCYFITRLNNVIYSSLVTAIMNSSERFAMSIGLPLLSTKTINFKEKAKTIEGAFSASKVKKFIPFISRPKLVDVKSIFFPSAIAMLSTLIIYLFISSAYLIFKISSAEQQIANQSTQVTKLLNQQNVFEDNQQNYKQLTDFWQNKNNISGVWIVVAPLFEQAKVNSITIKDNKFSIMGVTSTASGLLEQIIANPNVRSAKFETPVRKHREAEQFNISFKLKDSLFLPANSDKLGGKG